MVLTIISGLPGSHKENLCDFLMKVNQNSTRWENNQDAMNYHYNYNVVLCLKLDMGVSDISAFRCITIGRWLKPNFNLYFVFYCILQVEGWKFWLSELNGKYFSILYTLIILYWVLFDWQVGSVLPFSGGLWGIQCVTPSAVPERSSGQTEGHGSELIQSPAAYTRVRQTWTLSQNLVRCALSITFI